MNFFTHKQRFYSARVALVSIIMISTVTQSHAQNIGLRLMPIGDSITAGYRSSTGNGYRGPLWDELTKQGDALDFVGSQRSGVMFDPDNEGYYGDRIEQVAGLINKELALYQPNIITLLIGVNDLNQNHEVSTAPDRLASLIDQIVAADPRSAVLVGQLACDSNAEVEARIVSFNQQIPAIVLARDKAGKHVYMVSMSSITAADLKDGLHPNDAGYQKMADAWDAGIQRAIKAGDVPHIEFAGKFELLSVASGMALDVDGGSTSADAKIIQWPFNGGANQMWNFIPTSSGYYQIKNAYSALDLNVAFASKESGAPIIQWPFGMQGNDQWMPVRNADNSYEFRNQISGLYLDDASGKTQGSQLDQRPANGGATRNSTCLQSNCI